MKKLVFSILIMWSLGALAGEWIADAKSGCKVWNDNAKPNDSVSWSGDCSNGIAFGVGVLQWHSNGQFHSQFNGSLLDGKMTGKGVYKWTSGNQYEGDFIDGKVTGKGAYRWTNGDVYEGDFIDGKMTGKGIIKLADGIQYHGDFIDGKRTGKGIIKWMSGNQYEGDFVNGKITGKGVYRWTNGDVYEGAFIDGKKAGKGINRWADGSSYVGNYYDNEWKGFGTLSIPIGLSNIVQTWKDRGVGKLVNDKYIVQGIFDKKKLLRNCTSEDDCKMALLVTRGRFKWDGNDYEGDFKNGKPQGYGVVTFRNGNMQAGIWRAGRLILQCRSLADDCAKLSAEFATQPIDCKVNDVDINEDYRGECLNGLAHGKGSATGRDYYVGEFNGGNKHGYGIYTWDSGGRYVGNYLNDQQSGKGSYIDQSKRTDGVFQNGKLNGFGTHKYDCNCSGWSCNTCTDRGWWQMGKLVRNCSSEDSCEKQNRLEASIRKAEMEFRCEDARQLNQELEAINSSLFQYDSCSRDRKFSNLLKSTSPQEMYLAAGLYESNGERSQAKTIYRKIVDRFPKNQIAIKAADRLTRLADVEVVEATGQRAAQASQESRDASDSLRKANYMQCMNKRMACTNLCSGISRGSCESNCPVCTQ